MSTQVKFAKKQAEDTCAFLALKQGATYEHIFSVSNGSHNLGRRQLSVALNLPPEISKYISRRHCVITSYRRAGKEREYLIRNTSKTNGTYVNGRRLSSDKGDFISSGDLIQIGHLEFRFFEGAESWVVGEG